MEPASIELKFVWPRRLLCFEQRQDSRANSPPSVSRRGRVSVALSLGQLSVCWSPCMYLTVLRVRRLPRVATASTGFACELELASEARYTRDRQAVLRTLGCARGRTLPLALAGTPETRNSNAASSYGESAPQ